MTYFAYLDEFGHIGPYVSRQDLRHNDSPVFGLAGFVLPSERERAFGTWFFQRKCELLAFEIDRSGQHPAQWEKKGSSLYTVTNVTRYGELRKLTNRLFNKIAALDGFTFHVGIRKTEPPSNHNPNRLYQAILREAIKRIDEFCESDCHPPEDFALILDEHDQRSRLITEAARSMYRTGGASAASYRAAIPPRKPPLSDTSGSRLDRRSGGTPGCNLGGPGRLSRKPGVPKVLRAPLQDGQPKEWGAHLGNRLPTSAPLAPVVVLRRPAFPEARPWPGKGCTR